MLAAGVKGYQPKGWVGDSWLAKTIEDLPLSFSRIVSQGRPINKLGWKCEFDHDSFRSSGRRQANLMMVGSDDVLLSFPLLQLPLQVTNLSSGCHVDFWFPMSWRAPWINSRDSLSSSRWSHHLWSMISAALFQVHAVSLFLRFCIRAFACAVFVLSFDAELFVVCWIEIFHLGHQKYWTYMRYLWSELLPLDGTRWSYLSMNKYSRSRTHK